MAKKWNKRCNTFLSFKKKWKCYISISFSQSMVIGKGGGCTSIRKLIFKYPLLSNAQFHIMYKNLCKFGWISARRFYNHISDYQKYNKDEVIPNCHVTLDPERWHSYPMMRTIYKQHKKMLYLCRQNYKCSSYHYDHIHLTDPYIWVYISIPYSRKCHNHKPNGIYQIKLLITSPLKVLNTTNTEK